MKSKDYEIQVVERFGKPLKEIMYELCVVQDLLPIQGAEKLNVPKEIFIRWRSRFRYGPQQRMYDAAERRVQEMKNQYQSEGNVHLIDRPFTYEEEITLEGLEELISRKIEILKKNLTESEGNSIIPMNISINEMILEVINNYRSGQLINEVKTLIKFNK